MPQTAVIRLTNCALDAFEELLPFAGFKVSGTTVAELPRDTPCWILADIKWL